MIQASVARPKFYEAQSSYLYNIVIPMNYARIRSYKYIGYLSRGDKVRERECLRGNQRYTIGDRVDECLMPSRESEWIIPL